jgi:hypothetical protein
MASIRLPRRLTSGVNKHPDMRPEAVGTCRNDFLIEADQRIDTEEAGM